MMIVKGTSEVSVEFDHLEHRLRQPVQSCERIAAKTGQAGALEILGESAAADRAEIQGLRSTLDELSRIRWFATYTQIEDRAVGAERVRTLLRLLAPKHEVALQEDDADRKYFWDRMDAAVDRAVIR